MVKRVEQDMEGDKRRIKNRVPVEWLVEYESLEDFLIDYTANISIGGMFIKTRDPMPVGSSFKVSFRIPGRLRPVEAEAEVCWALRPEEAGPMEPGMGVQFRHLSDDDFASVQKYLDEWE